MPHALDGANASLPEISDDKCPICERKKHPTTTDKKENKGDLESKPTKLGCSPLPEVPDIPNYTTAAHHLIPANQCLKPQARLSQMCDAVGYDVNNSKNGMSLPTVGQDEENVYDGKKYGNLPPAKQLKVAFVLMEILDEVTKALPNAGAQWHVGHHNWKAPLQVKTDKFPHPPNYDKRVKTTLREMERDFVKRGKKICDDKKKERGKDVITELNNESQRIKGKVKGWDKYFVSTRAYQFAKQYR